MPTILRRPTILLVAILLWALAAVPAQAQQSDDELVRSTFGVGYVLAFDDFDLDNISAEDPDPAHGVSAWMGYRFNEWFASQIRGEYLNGFQFKFAGDDVRTEFASFTVGGKIYPLAPVSDALSRWVEPFIEIGGGFAWGEIDFNGAGNFREYGFLGRFAGGADIHFTEHFGLVVGVAWMQPTGELDELRHYSVTTGVQYRF